MQKSFRFFSSATAVCALLLLSACASGDTGSSPPRVPDSPALSQAKSQLRDIDWRIGQSESALRQLSPPIRYTDKGVTTFDADKQRQFEMNRNRIDRQIRDLRGERTIWDLRVSQIIQQESLAAQQRAAMPVYQGAPVIMNAPPGMVVAPPGMVVVPQGMVVAPQGMVVPPQGMVVMPPAMPAPVNPAVLQARDKIRDIDFQISRSESALVMLSRPMRTTTNGVTTFDVEKQRQYDLERARIDRQLRDLRADRTLWELRINQLSQ